MSLARTLIACGAVIAAFAFVSIEYGLVSLFACTVAMLCVLCAEDGSDLQTWPKTSAIYTQALLGGLLKRKWLMDSSVELPTDEIRLSSPITFDHQKLSKYRMMMKMKRSYDQVPLMYFIVEPFGMSMLLMVQKLPVTVLGLVLLRNESECFRPVESTEALSHSVKLSPKFRTTPKEDLEFDFIMDASDSSGFVVWRSTTTVIILNPKRVKALKGKKTMEQPKPEPIEGTLIDTFELKGDTGRQYASLNGDINPIHLYSWCSKLFGFRKPIAHALYQVGRSIAALENNKGMDVVGQWKLQTEFKRPTMLPCTLKLLDQSKGLDDGTFKFCLTTEDKLKEVIVGTLKKTST